MSHEELSNQELESSAPNAENVNANPNPSNPELSNESTVEETTEVVESKEVTEEPATEETVSSEQEVVAETKSNTASDEDEEEQNDSDEDDSMDESEEEDIDFETLNKDQLLALAVQATQNLTPREAFNRLKRIRPLFNDLLRAEKKEALQKHMEEGLEPDDFTFDDESYREQFKNAYNLAKNARMEERQRIEEEKLKNFKKKEGLLDKLRSITESDETEKSLDEVKEIQQEWRAIRVLPTDKVQELWDSYHFLLDKFYDNHSINIELKELDRKKNLEVKIDLCKKVDELSTENSIKKSFILLNKYQEEFRNTGPVPREFNKEIWERFRAACDKVYEQKKAVFDALEEDRKKNLERKQVLIEKAEMIAAIAPKKVKEWKEKASELDSLMEDWKKIGQVPKAKNDEVWKAFRKSFNTFYENKSEYFKEIHKERKANLIVKEDICKRAEELKDSEDLNYATNEVKKLQKEWKEVGPVPDKVSNAIWKRFRAACDELFDKKQQAYAGRKEEETKNLELKNKLIEKLETLLEQASGDSILKELKAVQSEWNAIGFVPFKKKKDIENKYRAVSDKVFSKFKLDKQSVKQGHMKDHYANIAQLPSGKQKLKDEAYRITKKMKFLSEEIATLENNMEFFGRSKGAQKLKDDIAAKIAKTKEQLDRMRAELKVIKSADKPAPKPVENVETTAVETPDATEGNA